MLYRDAQEELTDMKGKLALLAGAAVGYVFGTRAGRERYEQIKSKATDVWQNPKLQERVSEAEHFVTEKAPDVQAKINEAAKSAMDAARSRFGDSDADGIDADTYDAIDADVTLDDDFAEQEDPRA